MSENSPKYPDIKVQLSGEDGNAFFILGRCKKAMRIAGLSSVIQEQFFEEATDGDYDHLLVTVMSWFDAS